MVIQITHFFLFLFIIFINGKLLNDIIFKKKILNITETIFFGVISTGLFAFFIHIFFPLKNFLLYTNFIFGLIFLFFKRKDTYFLIQKKTLILIFFLILLQVYGSYYSDDLAHYHSSFIINHDNLNLIIGSNFLHNHFGFNSIWLTLHSYLNLNETYLYDIHIVNSIIFFAFIYYFLSEIQSNKFQKKYYGLVTILLLFVFLKYTRLKEFGIDRPVILIFFFLLYFSLKFQNVLESKNNSKFLFLLFLTCLFLTSAKFFFIYSFIVPFYFLLRSKNYCFIISKLSIIFCLFILIFAIKNLLVSGCLIYPLFYTCVEFLPWTDFLNIKDFYLGIQSHVKGFDRFGEIQANLSREEFLSSFTWFSYWFKNIKTEIIEFFILIFFITISQKFIFISKNNNNKSLKLLFLILIALNLIIFFNTPVIRYHHTLFLLISIFCSFYFGEIIDVKKKIFNSIIILALTFNASKNILRIYKTNYINDPIKILKNIEWYQEPKRHRVDEFIYYIGWIDAYPLANKKLKGIKVEKKSIFYIIKKI